MRQQVIAVLALSVLMLFPIEVIGQNKDSTRSWPSLGSAEENVHEGRPRFIMESQIHGEINWGKKNGFCARA